MMMKKKEYVFVGEGEGNGSIHWITSVSKSTVTTWSGAGYSWMGTQDQFKDEFEPVERESA